MSITIDIPGESDFLPLRIQRFPFPFRDDIYRYSANVEPANKNITTDAGEWGRGLIDIDDFYLGELADREQILARDPSRSQILPHMKPAAWDTIATLLPSMAEENPEIMSFQREGNHCHWHNSLQDLDIEFTIGDDDSLPMEPLRFLSTQIQDDIVLLDIRDNTLWLDAGVVSFAADWSFNFDVGMSFREIHSPVPRIKEENIIQRAEQFLMRLQPGEQFRRTNWTMTIGRRLDTSTETYPEWGPDRGTIATDPDMPDKLHLRVEVQHLVRLPHSGTLLFLIRSYLLPLRDIARVPAWREKFGNILAELPEDMAAYKGITRYRKAAADWLLGRP